MNRYLNLSPCCEMISLSRKYSHHTLLEEIEIIIEYKGEPYIIKDEMEKVIDISLMPNYIKDDWINYSKKTIDDKTITEHIRNCEEKINSQYPPDNESENILSKLKSIKRDLIIRKII